MTALDPLANMPRWVAWRTENRNGKATKVPYSPHRGKAKTDDPSTWGIRAEAEAAATRLVNGAGGGVGIQLGDLGDGRFLAGIDLDACIAEDGVIATWATAILNAAPTYAEKSPSGRGIKLFFRTERDAVRPFLDRVGVKPDSWGCRRDAPGEDARNHGPAIEVYFAGRYFAVTGERWSGAPDEVATLGEASLIELAALIPGPRNASLPQRREERGCGDGSRSAVVLGIASRFRATGKTFEEFRETVKADAVTASWYNEKGAAYGERDLKRAWGKASDAAKKNTNGFPPVVQAPPFSDEALALRFSQKHADDSRYVAAWGRWLLWEGVCWKIDATLRVVDLARAICRAAAAEANKGAREIASAKTVAAVVSLARADRRHAATAEQWDTDPWLFLTEMVAIDLRSGESRLPRREDYCTRRAAPISLGGPCPLWHQFLDRITGGNRELQAYLQRIAGYCMTGITSEQVLFFLYGTGANGKSVFVNTLVGIWGDYAVVAPMETFIAASSDRHPTELAGLRGARLVVANETERDRAWAESKVKAVTGGDRISARFMRQDFFEFVPLFKLVIIGNHKPSLGSVDEAIRRRIHLVPFIVTIPEAERDPDLPIKLRDEWGGILQWAIDGCREWQLIGLGPPQVVKDATAQYLAEEDSFARWVEECCVTGKQHFGVGDDLWTSWRDWAERCNEPAGTRKGFANLLEARGFLKGKQNHRRGYKGIAWDKNKVLG